MLYIVPPGNVCFTNISHVILMAVTCFHIFKYFTTFFTFIAMSNLFHIFNIHKMIVITH
jgi:hypothetical protein